MDSILEPNNLKRHLRVCDHEGCTNVITAIRRGGKQYCDTCRSVGIQASKEKARMKERSDYHRSPEGRPLWEWLPEYLRLDKPDLSEATRRRNLMYLSEFGV